MVSAIKKVERYELKLSDQRKVVEKLGIGTGAFWASFPAGSEERIALNQLERIQEDLNRANNELAKRKIIEDKMPVKPIREKNKIEKQATWMQSKTGMWHKFGFESDGEKYPSCQSYNLDRPNILSGESLNNPPEEANVCKKCQSKNSGKLWDYVHE